MGRPVRLDYIATARKLAVAGIGQTTMGVAVRPDNTLRSDYHKGCSQTTGHITNRDGEDGSLTNAGRTRRAPAVARGRRRDGRTDDFLLLLLFVVNEWMDLPPAVRTHRDKRLWQTAEMGTTTGGEARFGVESTGSDPRRSGGRGGGGGSSVAGGEAAVVRRLGGGALPSVKSGGRWRWRSGSGRGYSNDGLAAVVRRPERWRQWLPATATAVVVEKAAAPSSSPSDDDGGDGDVSGGGAVEKAVASSSPPSSS
uniref:Uncharacterized protein n=1 Tax=Oryza sativa subsp. japonica TaxID=39947 RepID=Q6Z579_ORYSJ|nr:hypothetical protein [Oryza sativa Japonica Group]